jgi:transcriptional regulator with GAF, ATPase, and Fis domain
MEGAYEAEGFFPHLGEKGKQIFFTSAPLRDFQGKIIGAIETLQDITERKQAEDRIRHLNQLLHGIRNVNQLIAHEGDRDKLLQGVCRVLMETQGYYHAWIALLDESGKLMAHAESGLGKDFLPFLECLKRGELPACGQQALSQWKTVVTVPSIKQLCWQVCRDSTAEIWGKGLRAFVCIRAC